MVSKSCWVCTINRPRVWTSHTGQTGCVTGFSPSCHSGAWAVCISAGQNDACLIKVAREEIGFQTRSKVILRHAQQDFDTISSELFLFSPIFRVPGKTSVIRVRLVMNKERILWSHTRFFIRTKRLNFSQKLRTGWEQLRLGFRCKCKL